MNDNPDKKDSGQAGMTEVQSIITSLKNSDILLLILIKFINQD